MPPTILATLSKCQQMMPQKVAPNNDNDESTIARPLLTWGRHDGELPKGTQIHIHESEKRAEVQEFIRVLGGGAWSDVERDLRGGRLVPQPDRVGTLANRLPRAARNGRTRGKPPDPPCRLYSRI